MTRKSQSGQALVLVLLSLAVVLTLVLFILSRSVTDVAVSGRQEESVRAFSAAEAGIEQALVVGSSIPKTGIGDASYTTSFTDYAQGLTIFNDPVPLSSGDSATIWFVAHNPDGSLGSTVFTGDSMKICWGAVGSSGNSDTTPAIEVSIYYETKPGTLLTVKVARDAFDPFNSTGLRTVPNSFAAAPVVGTCTIGDQSYAFQKTVTFSDFSPVAVNTGGLMLAKIRMFYNDSPQKVGVSVTGGTLPSQGKEVDSSGVAGASNRRITVFQGWAEFPFASNALLVPGDITK